MQKNAGKRTAAGILAVAVTLLAGTAAYAQTWVWTNADADNDYMNGNNWTTNGVVAGSPPNQEGGTKDDVAQINSNGVDKCVYASATTTDNINSVDVGSLPGASGELEVNGPGILKATSHSSRYSTVGFGAGATGLVTVNGGTWEVNRARIGRDGGVGTVVVNGGTYKVSRGNGGYSIWLDISAGDTEGNLEVNGGLVTTRTGVQINDNGTMTVKGGASTIKIGGAGGADQCKVDVNAGGTLAVQVASNGLSAIEIDNEHATDASYATFAAGSFLEPSFFGGHIETNAWIVMTLDDSDVAGTGITATELELAVGVDPLWDFGVTNNPVEEVDVLWIGYAGAEYVPPPPPEFVTNVFVNAVVPLSEDYWNLTVDDPGNASSLSDQSSSGFTATFHHVLDADPFAKYPVVAQELASAQDLSEVGQSVTFNFDVELLDVPASNGNDFRMVFYDTALNASWWWGIDIGQSPGSTVSRMLPYISNSDTNQFVAGDYALLGLGYDSLPSSSGGGPGIGLLGTGVVNHIEMTLTRISTNEVELTGAWTDESTSSTGTMSCVFDEAAPTYPQWAPIPDGKWDSVDGFGLTIYDPNAFSATPGSFVVSNFEVIYTDSIGLDFTYEIADIAVDSSDDVTLTLSDPVVGATYKVYAGENLLIPPMTEIGSYVAEAPGVLNIPAADAAPYVGDAGFFDVSLPIIVVIE